MYSFSEKVLHQCFALVYFDEILILALTKTNKLGLIKTLHQLFSSNYLEIAPEKLFYIFLTVKFFGFEIILLLNPSPLKLKAYTN